ncbi:MAG: M48 family metalloprotease [Planctomycetes bacterium]|nr:M48 family metalloprotease [Planctomycetota bacterium]
MKFVPKELKQTADASRGSMPLRRSFKVALITALVLGASYVLLWLAAEGVAAALPEAWEARLFPLVPLAGEDASAVGEDPPAAPPGLRRAREVFQRLTREPGLRPLPYRLFLLDLKEPNAVAVPGGAVGVTRGLLEAVKSEGGLAMVLGHELGHHQGRHCLKRLGRALLLKGATSLLFGGESSSVVGSLLDVAESGYSRRQEEEADELGLRLVRDALGHTEGCLELFEHLDREHGAKESPWAAFLSSHPLTRDRIERLRRLAEGMAGPR